MGDRISYILQGTSPWQIAYEFNGKRNIAKTSHPTFSRNAEKKENLTIVSVADRASTCDPFVQSGKMEKFMHEVPSVRISEGTNIIENIREGPSPPAGHCTDGVGDQAEILFQFVGEPPFNMTLRVSSIADKKNRKSKSLQMHTINNVQGYTHWIYTSQGGVMRLFSCGMGIVGIRERTVGSAVAGGKVIEYYSRCGILLA